MNGSECFALGPIATGDRFIGREREIEQLSAVFSGQASIHLIGASRIGKSSLVAKVFERNSDVETVLPIRLDMATYQEAFDFWYDLGMTILEAAEEKGVDFPGVSSFKAEIEAADPSQRSWHMRIQRPLKKMLKALGQSGYRVVVAIDEFDAVPKVFGADSSQYQLLRSILSDDEYAINGIVVSRRNLNVLAEKAKVTAISSFENVFSTLRLLRFDEKDMDLFYLRLENAGNVTVDEGGKERFEYYTGRIPYLCCMLAISLIDKCESTDKCIASADQIDEVRLERQFEIQHYYDDLIGKLEEDDHLEPLVYLAFDEMKTLAYEHNRNNMIQMGYLNEDQVGDSCEYHAYCKDFMSYLRHRKLNMPIRDLLDAGEHKLKEVFAAAYPQFTQVTYEDIVVNHDFAKADLLEGIRGLRYKWQESTEKFLRDAAVYMDNPTVLDTLTINYVLLQIHKYHWNDVFSRYFNNDTEWREKLKEVDGIRNPFSHAHGEYVPQEKVERCAHILEELLKYEIKF